MTTPTTAGEWLAEALDSKRTRTMRHGEVMCPCGNRALIGDTSCNYDGITLRFMHVGEPAPVRLEPVYASGDLVGHREVRPLPPPIITHHFSTGDDLFEAAMDATYAPATDSPEFAALRAIVELHRRVACDDDEYPHDAICDECMDEYPCPTLRSVAEMFRGREGYERWFA